MKFADNLRNLRKSKKISQEELAEKVGVSRQSVSKWETSEAYPEMNNILELCKIFNCNISELVNDKMIDLDSLDEEVKMSVVKFKKEKQKQMKGISKIISVIGKIGAIVLRVCLGFLIAIMVLLPIGLLNVDIKNGTIIPKNDSIKIVEREDITEIRVGKKVVIGEFEKKDVEVFSNSIENYSKPGTIALFELGFVVLGAFLIVLIKVLKHLEKLFKNINEGDTPFTLENVNHIKSMTCLMIACIILPGIAEIIINIPLKGEFISEFTGMNIIEILFLYSMGLIFEYGYEIQRDSKGKMYGEEN